MQLVYFGQPVKHIKTENVNGVDVATLGGHLVLFTDAGSPDLEGEYFDADTYLGPVTKRGEATVDAYYQHGFDSHFKSSAIGEADLSIDEFGVWAEYQIELRTEYEKHLVAMAQKGALGQSSGAVGHLVKKTKTGDAWHIDNWPIGEASLTPTPAEPRTSAMPLKAYKAWAETLETPEPRKVPVEIEVTVTTKQETAMSDQTKTAEPKAVEEKETQDGSAIISLEDVKAVMADGFKAFRENMKSDTQAIFDTSGAPAFVKSTGDTEAKSFKAWALGDDAAMGHAIAGKDTIEIKASNDTDMNITTAADGGRAVPTGHFGNIIARRDESRLNVGVRDIPGVGTTVNVPLDAEDDSEFVVTSEAAANDRDAPALGTVAMTLAKYTKRIELSDELLQDEESRLMSFIEDFVGRGMAKTHNSLLVTEVNTNGSTLKTTTSATVLAAGELEAAVYGNNVAHYLGEGAGGGNWIMQPATYAPILSLTGNHRLYAPQAQGGSIRPDILGYPVNFSNKVEVYGTTAKKFAIFGNFAYVGRREEPSFKVLRDPYSAATTGQLRLHYYFRTIYKVLQAEAVGFVVHA